MIATPGLWLYPADRLLPYVTSLKTCDGFDRLRPTFRHRGYDLSVFVEALEHNNMLRNAYLIRAEESTKKGPLDEREKHHRDGGIQLG